MARDYLIRIALNVFVFIMLLSGTLNNIKAQKMVSVFTYFTMLVALALIMFHYYIIVKNQTLLEKQSYHS